MSLFAPTEAPADTDNVRILPLRQEQLQQQLGNRYRELDVPLLVEWEDGKREILLFVVEEETDPRRFSVHRLAHYCIDLAEMFDTERVVPVVIFLGLTDGERPMLRLGSERRECVFCDYLGCWLGDMPYEDWADSANTVQGSVLPFWDRRPPVGSGPRQ